MKLISLYIDAKFINPLWTDRELMQLHKKIKDIQFRLGFVDERLINHYRRKNVIIVSFDIEGIELVNMKIMSATSYSERIKHEIETVIKWPPPYSFES